MALYHSENVLKGLRDLQEFASSHTHPLTPLRSSAELGVNISPAQDCGKIYRPPSRIRRSCFTTTGMMVGRIHCVQVTQILFDTGACASFISPQAVQLANLKARKCTPRDFYIGDGSCTTLNKFVELQLYIAGVDQQIHAFVDDEYTGWHLLLGQPALTQFRVQSDHCFGPHKEQRWTAAKSSADPYKCRVILDADAVDAEPSLTVYDHRVGLRIATRLGETAAERNRREILERSEARVARFATRLGLARARHSALKARLKAGQGRVASGRRCGCDGNDKEYEEQYDDDDDEEDCDVEFDPELDEEDDSEYDPELY